MVGEHGHFALILAFVVATIQGTVPLAGAWRRVPCAGVSGGGFGDRGGSRSRVSLPWHVI